MNEMTLLIPLGHVSHMKLVMALFVTFLFVCKLIYMEYVKHFWA